MDQVPKGEIFLTDKKIDTTKFNHVRVYKGISELELKKSVSKMYSENSDNRIYIGIDPGQQIGIAIVYCSRVIDSTVVLSIKLMIFWIKQRLKMLGQYSIVIKIGDGWKDHLKEFLFSIHRDLGNRATIQIVNEERTSIRSTNNITIHEQAAAKIANRDGVPFNAFEYQKRSEANE